jgi:predicted acylesterase/phospholipase RssA
MILKWPIFLVLFVIVAILTLIYFTVRSLIVFLEKLTDSVQVNELKEELEESKSFSEYRGIANKLDVLTGAVKWKKQPESPFYNSELVQKHIQDLQHYKEIGDYDRLLGTLRECLSEPNFGGVLNKGLYSQSYIGTKYLVEEYVDTVCMALYSIKQYYQGKSEHFEDLISLATYGRTALCLSGGGAIASQHFGVIEVLRKSNSLPQIIQGTSGGAIVGAFFATRTDKEIELEFDAGNLYEMLCAFDIPWYKRIYRLFTVGEMFDSDDSYNKLGKWCKFPDITFKEAYERTGCILNVTVTNHQPNISSDNNAALLNYITAPNVIIRSAVFCSSAFPTFFKPRGLYEKMEDGKIIERSILRFADGSLVTDIPKDKLAAIYNVRFTIVSQVNPHVTPFFFNMRGEAGKPLLWRMGSNKGFRGGFILSSLEVLFKEIIKALVKVVRDLEIGPTTGGLPWVHVFLQNFQGDVTLVSSESYWYKLFNALDNPKSVKDVEWWLQQGRLMTWPKLSMIQARMRIEKAINQLR